MKGPKRCLGGLWPLLAPLRSATVGEMLDSCDYLLCCAWCCCCALLGKMLDSFDYYIELAQLAHAQLHTV